MAKQTFMSRVKAYRKEHPHCSQVEAMKKLKGKTVSGPAKRKTVAGTKTKRPRIEGKKVVASTRPTGVKAAGYRIARGIKILKEIDKLEAKAKEVKNKDLKTLYYVEINGLHKKLRNLKQSA